MLPPASGDFLPPELLLYLNQFLHLQDQICLVQVSRFFYKTFQPTLPKGSVCWKDTLSQNERSVALHRLQHGHVRELETHLQFFEGKALYYQDQRQAQVRVWEPIKRALLTAAVAAEAETEADEGGYMIDTSPKLELQRWVIQGGNFLEEDIFEVLLKVRTIRYLSIDPLPGRHYSPDLSKLFKILGLAHLQPSLRCLVVMNGWWPNTGLPFPNKVRCRLQKLVLDRTRLTEPNLMRLLESCPELEEVRLLEVIQQLSPVVLKHITKVNPQLKGLWFKSAGINGQDLCGDVQVKWMMEHLPVKQLESLGLYRLMCSPETFLDLQDQFSHLKRLEIGEASSDEGLLLGQMVCQYLTKASQLRHLVAKDVFIPVWLLKDGMSWVCKDLNTLEVSFSGSEGEQLEREESRIVCQYLADHVSLLERLWVRKQGLLHEQQDIVEMLKTTLPLKQGWLVSQTNNKENKNEQVVDLAVEEVSQLLTSFTLE
ncbi:hypothetical protein EDD11_000977 [Mortierella claussenii]|nr:hypothetical protein EDD11_000977 [Mortierella claussenii]